MGIPLIGGLLDGGSNGNKAREEEERRKAEEAAREAEAAEERRAAEAEAAEERQAELDAAAESRRESSLGSFERRPVREDDRGAPIQRRALESIATQRDEPQTPVTPQFQMSIPEDEIRFQANVDIPEDEIRFTPNAPAEQPDPYRRVLDASAPYQQGAAGGRAVDFDALDAQQDAADVASASQARANLGGGGAPPPVTPQPQSGAVAPPQTTPTLPASGPAQPPETQGPAPSSPLAPPAPPAAVPLPQQQRAVDARQQTVAPQGSRIPADVRTAAMPPRGESPQAPDTSSEDEARTALRRERILKALGYITKIGLGAGALALDARGGSPAAAQFMAGAGGMVGNAMINGSPTQQQARITQARGVDEQRARTAEDLDLRRVTQAAQERRAQMLEAQQAQRLDLESRRVGAMEEGLGLRAEQIGAQAEAARALAAQRQSQGERQSLDAQLERDLDDPTSEASAQARRELRILNEQQPDDKKLPDDQLEGITGRAAQILYTQMSRPYGNRTRETRRGGGGGGGGPRAEGLGPTRSFRDFAQREYPQLQGMSEAEREAAVSQAWSQLSSAERRAYIGGSAMADTREDDERAAVANAIPGWSLRPNEPPPDTVSIRTAQTLAASDQTMRRSLSTATSALGGIDTWDRATSWAGFDTPETQRFRTAIDTAISEMTSYVNTGALNEADQRRYERMFGSLYDLTSASVIRERLGAIQRELTAKANTRMGTLGFTQGGGGESRGGGGQMYTITPPDGRPRRTSNPAHVEAARRRGWTVEGP